MHRIITQHRFFAACIVLSLGVGISGAAGVIATVDSLRYGALPFRHADRIEHLYTQSRTKAGSRSEEVPAIVYRAVRAPDSPAEDVAAYHGANFQIRDGERVFTALGARTTPNFATLLGARVALGRPFDSTDARQPVLLVGYQFWRTELGGDSSVIGRSIEVNGESRRIVGVATREWEFPERIAFWVPSLDLNQLESKNRRVSVLVRLAPDANTEHARSQLVALGSAAVAGIRHRPNERLASTSFREFVRLRLDGIVFVLTIISVFVGFLTAVNFAALVLARGIRRRGEIGVRAALGASVARLARHIVGETLLLSALGGVLAAVLAPFVVGVIRDGFAGIMPPWLQVTYSWRAVIVSALLATIFGIVFALGPAVDLARPALAAFLHAAGSTTADGGRLARTRSWIVGIQVALATGVLIALGALMGKSILMREPVIGFDARQLIVSDVSDSGRADVVSNRLGGVHSTIATIPGIEAAAYLEEQALDPARLIVERGSTTVTADAEGIEDLRLERASEGFFRVMRPRVTAGRLFSADEETRGAPVAVVSRRVAHELFADDAVGKRIRLDGDQPRTIIGTVDDIRFHVYQPDPTFAVFTPMSSRFATSDGRTSRQLWIRATGSVPSIVRTIQSRVATNQFGGSRVAETRSLASDIARDLTVYRSVSRLLLAIFAVALGLAALGIYGFVAYTAEMRSRELAIREALGASRIQVAGLMLKGAFIQALAGAAAGAMLSIIAVDYLNGFQLKLKATGGATVVAFIVVSATVLISSIGPLMRTWRRELSLTLRV
jgi:putative ABC transport system permease protein